MLKSQREVKPPKNAVAIRVAAAAAAAAENEEDEKKETPKKMKKWEFLKNDALKIITILYFNYHFLHKKNKTFIIHNRFDK